MATCECNSRGMPTLVPRFCARGTNEERRLCLVMPDPSIVQAELDDSLKHLNAQFDAVSVEDDRRLAGSFIGALRLMDVKKSPLVPGKRLKAFAPEDVQSYYGAVAAIRAAVGSDESVDSIVNLLQSWHLDLFAWSHIMTMQTRKLKEIEESLRLDCEALAQFKVNEHRYLLAVLQQLVDDTCSALAASEVLFKPGTETDLSTRTDMLPCDHDPRNVHFLVQHTHFHGKMACIARFNYRRALFLCMMKNSTEKCNFKAAECTPGYVNMKMLFTLYILRRGTDLCTATLAKIPAESFAAGLSVYAHAMSDGLLRSFASTLLRLFVDASKRKECYMCLCEHNPSQFVKMNKCDCKLYCNSCVADTPELLEGRCPIRKCN